MAGENIIRCVVLEITESHKHQVFTKLNVRKVLESKSD